MTSWLTRASYLALVPIGLTVRLTRDPLRIRRAPALSNWTEEPAAPATIDAARRDG